MTLIEAAAKEGRGYITPEDVQDLVSAGGEKLAVYEELLRHIERGNAEDYRLCCFVALEWKLDTDKDTTK